MVESDTEKVSKLVAKVAYIHTNYTDVTINKGSNDGVRVGQKFLIYGVGPDIIDPDTKKSLGRVELVRGKAEAVHVQPAMSTLRSIEKRSQTKKRITQTSTTFVMLPSSVTEEIEPASSEFNTLPTIGDFASLIS